MTPPPASSGAATLTGLPPRFERGLREVGPGTWAWLQPNGGWGEANAGLVVGDGEALVVDTLWDQRLAEEMLAAMAPHLEGRPVRHVVNTHSDGDHWWGNATMPADAQIVTSTPSLALIEEEGAPAELARMARLSGILARVPGPLRPMGRYVSAMLAPFDFAGVRPRRPDRAFSGTETLEVGGREVRLIEVGPAHTRGDAIVHVPDAGVVFAADVLFAEAVPVMWAGPVESWLRALDTLASLDAEVYVPGHGPPGGRALVDEMRAFLTWAGEATAEQHRLGRTPLETTRAMLRSGEFARWGSWECPERLLITVTTIHRALDGKGPLRATPPTRARLFSQIARLSAEGQRR